MSAGSGTSLMLTSLDQFRLSIRRRAIVMEIGGFRPPEDPLASWFGRVGFALSGEAWPCTDGRPMHALCQINLTQLPFRPPRLEDLEFITVFIGPVKLPTEGANANGTNWCLRTYPSVKALAPLAAVQTGSPIKALPMRPSIVEEDFPCLDDVPSELPPEVEDEYEDLFPNTSGFKLGGWPTLIQSEITWGPGGKHPIDPEYVFQIGTTQKGNWMWGDNGTGYFGRGRAAGGRDEWAIEWQCY